ncbi:MAG: hypothetical protein GY847_20495 [Proteobacteria bacterium]|nr:hypothetical protein [Pseudomonadota bacterium]
MTKKYLANKSRFRGANIAIFLVWLSAATSFAGCYLYEDWNEIEPITVQHALDNNANCSSFESYAKLSAIQLMRAQIEATRDEEAEWAGQDDGRSTPNSDEESIDISDDSNGDEGGEHSETNVQEKGVDEADLVKTDGDYIYTLHLGELIIIDAAEDGQMVETGRAEVGGYADELFIYGNLAVVFSSLSEQEVPEELHYYVEDVEDGPNISVPEIDCWDERCYGSYEYAQIALVDITERDAPQVVRTIIYAGEYETSRRIDNSLRAVIYSPLPALEMVWDHSSYDDDRWGSESKVNKFYKKLIKKNEARFNALSLEQILPNKLDSVEGEIAPISECKNILGSKTPAGIGLTTVISINLDAPNKPETEVSVFGAKGIVYASTSSLYLTTSRQYVLEAFESGLWTDETSGIHKFDISRSDSAAYYLATGTVPGRMLDQFCLGEKDDYLRVATTTGARWNRSELENHVRVLEEQGDDLVIVGKLDKLGVGEEIYAARFMGDRGFMVTYYETDPLYTLDMSDPTNPKTVGEWHGPGYSTYLHPIGENLILSVGLYERRVAVSLYDITDFADPTLTTRLLFPNTSYSSAAAYEHKALTFNPKTGFLALPYHNQENNDTGIYTYDVQETGITQLTALHLNEGRDDNEGGASRSIYIGDYLYGISRCRITSGPIDDPSPAIATLPLSTIGSCDDYGNEYYRWNW